MGDKNNNVTHPIIFCCWRIDVKLGNLVSVLVHDEKYAERFRPISSGLLL